MRWAGPDARWLVAAGLIVPSLLLIDPAASLADGKSAGHPQKRTAARESHAGKSQAAKRQAGKSEPGAKGKPVASGRADARRTTCAYMARGRESPRRLAARLRVARQQPTGSARATSPAALVIGPRLAARFCAPRPEPRRPEPSTPAVEIDDGLLLAPVGPARIPTRLYVAVPEFNGEAVEFAWPAEGIIASVFGRRHGGWHAGIDIMAEPGAPVQAAAAGVVSFSGWAGSYGRLVKIEHPNGFVTVYAHNDEILVQAGDEVDAGTQIATVGRTGKASGEHLHFEIRRDGMAYNPLHLLVPRDGPPIVASTASEPSELLLQAADATGPVDDGR